MKMLFPYFLKRNFDRSQLAKQRFFCLVFDMWDRNVNKTRSLVVKVCVSNRWRLDDDKQIKSRFSQNLPKFCWHWFSQFPKGHHKRLLWKIVECLSAQASNAEAASVAKTAQNPTWVKWRKKMKNVLPNSFEFLIHQFNSLNRELIHELWINSSIQPVSESYAQRFYHWGHAGVREIFRQQTLGCPLSVGENAEFCML